MNLILGGYDHIEEEPRLHILDYFGSDIECPYGAHGYGAMFTMSILDRHYNKYVNLLQINNLIWYCTK